MKRYTRGMRPNNLIRLISILNQLYLLYQMPNQFTLPDFVHLNEFSVQFLNLIRTCSCSMSKQMSGICSPAAFPIGLYSRCSAHFVSTIHIYKRSTYRVTNEISPAFVRILRLQWSSDTLNAAFVITIIIKKENTRIFRLVFDSLELDVECTQKNLLLLLQ